MDVEETRLDCGRLGAAGGAPSCGREGCDADRARASWLKLLLCNEWVLLCVAGRRVGLGARCVGLEARCWTRES